MRLVVLALCLLLFAADASANNAGQVLQAIGVIVSFIPGFQLVGMAIMTIGGVYGSQLAQRAAADAQRATQQAALNSYNNALRDRTITRVATDAPFMYVYGRARVGSSIVAMFPSGARDEYKWLVCVHAAHECDAIEEIYVGGVALGPLDSNGDITGANKYSVGSTLSNAVAPYYDLTESFTGTSHTLVQPTAIFTTIRVMNRVYQRQKSGIYTWVNSPVAFTYTGGATPSVAVATSGTYYVIYDYTVYTSHVRVTKHLGTAGDPADAALVALGAGWDASCTLTGLCYTVVRLCLDQAEFQGGIPAIEVLLRGKKLYDVRTGTTAWSQNNALAIYDYLTSEMCGVPANDIPVADYITAANVCDESVVVPNGNAVYLVPSVGTLNAIEDVSLVLSALTYTSSIYVKQGAYRYVSFAHGTTSCYLMHVDLQAGTILGTATAGTGVTGVSTSITAIGSGWYRITLTASDTGGARPTSVVRPSNVATVPVSMADTIVSDGVSGIYCAMPQVEVGTAASQYRPTTGYPNAVNLLSNSEDMTSVLAWTFTNASASMSPNGVVMTRYTCNGTITADQDQAQMLTALADSMGGGVVGTTWSCWAGKYIASIKALDQSDIVGALSVVSGTPDASLYNGAKGQYIGAENQYVVTDFTPYQNSAYVTSDGGEQWGSVSYLFTDSCQRIWNLARMYIEDQRLGFTIKAVFSLKCWSLRCGDRVTLTSTFLGQTNQVYRITDKKFGPDQGVELTLKMDASTVWDLVDAVTVVSTPPTSLPNPFSVAPPGNVLVSEALYTTTGSVGVRSVATVTWTAPASGTVMGYEVWYKPYNTGVWLTQTIAGITTLGIPDLTPGQWDFRVRARNVLGSYSTLTDILTTTLYGLTAPPNDVVGFAVTIANGVAQCSWTKTVDLDVQIGGKVVIRHCPLTTGATWGQSYVLDEFNGDATSGFVPAYTGTYYAKFVDSTGHYSNTEASFVATESWLTGYTTIATSVQAPTFSGAAMAANMLSYSEQFDNAVWIKINTITVTANTTLAPDGTTSGDTVTDSDTVNPALLEGGTAVSLPVGTQVTASIYAQQGTSVNGTFNAYDGGGTENNLSIAWASGVPSITGFSGVTGATYGFSYVGGWYRFWITWNMLAAGTITHRFWPCDRNIATLTGSVILWGAQVNLGVLGAYVKSVATPAPTLTAVSGALLLNSSVFAGVLPFGEYLFNATMDCGSVAARRFFVTLAAQSGDTGDTIDLRTALMDTWPSFDGGVINDTDATVLASVSNDNITYGPWTPFMTADFTCRYAQFKAQLVSGLPTHNIQLTTLTVTAKTSP